MSREIEVRPLSEARVFSIRTDPGSVLLGMTSEGQTIHYRMAVTDLANLAERLRLDAVLLKGAAP